MQHLALLETARHVQPCCNGLDTCQCFSRLLLLLLLLHAQVRCDVLREGKRLSVTVTLGERGAYCAE